MFLIVFGRGSADSLPSYIPNFFVLVVAYHRLFRREEEEESPQVPPLSLPFLIPRRWVTESITSAPLLLRGRGRGLLRPKREWKKGRKRLRDPLFFFPPSPSSISYLIPERHLISPYYTGIYVVVVLCSTEEQHHGSVDSLTALEACSVDSLIRIKAVKSFRHKEGLLNPLS